MIATRMLDQKQRTLQELEEALGEETVRRLCEQSECSDGSQYRPTVIESPGRLAILQQIQHEESSSDPGHDQYQHMRSARITASVGINMGLDLERRL